MTKHVLIVATFLASWLAAPAAAQTVSATFALRNATAIPVTVAIGDEALADLAPGARLARTRAFAAAPGAYRVVPMVAAWPAGRCEATLRVRAGPEPLIPPDCIGAGSRKQARMVCSWESRPEGAACAISFDVRPE